MSLPDALDNISAPIKGLAKQPRKSSYGPSFYHFVMNPNISYRKIKEMSREEKIRMYKGVTNAFEELKQSLEAGTWACKKNMKDSTKKRLDKFGVWMEVGQERGFLHFDGIISFDGFCQLNLSAISTHFNTSLAEWSKGVHFNVRVVQDQIKIAEDYAAKDSNKLL